MSGSSLDIHSLDRYRDHLLQEERAPATVEKYLRDAGAFAAWLEGRPVSRELVQIGRASCRERVWYLV